MRKERELWEFVMARLRRDENVVLLVVADSSGSSPGRAGYKMAVGKDGQLSGSIGGGMMEVAVAELAKKILSEFQHAESPASSSELIEQQHRRNASHPSGMICSGEQTIISKLLTPNDISSVITAAVDLDVSIRISPSEFAIGPHGKSPSHLSFEKLSDTDFIYSEHLGPLNELVIIGGGHCALALSEIMSKMDFRIRIFDDRPELNTIEKNGFADWITIVDSYEDIGGLVPYGENLYVVVMTIGYRTDAMVIRHLAGREFKYFGVLGSKAKMGSLMRGLIAEGMEAHRLEQVRTPIGIQINSHTPEEIAISIAAEIISVKNA